MHKTFGVSPTDKDLVTRIIRSLLPSALILAFGSRIQKTAKRYSDLDLAIDDSAPISFERLSQLRERFSNSQLPYMVDIVDFHDLTPEFRAHVLATSESW